MATDETTPSAPSAAWKGAAVFVVWSVDGTVLSASDSYAELVGRSLDDIIGERWPELVPDEAEFGWQQLHFSVEALRTAPVVVVDMPTRASGATSWLRWTEWAVRDVHGELVQVRSTAVDVSELHETRAALAATIDVVAAARAAGRQEVVDQLHNGAVQQLTAARWALADGDIHGALSLVDSALGAVRSSVDALDPPHVGVPLVSAADMPAGWVGRPSAFGESEMPSWLADAALGAVSDSVLVFAASGVVWAPVQARAVFGDRSETIDLAVVLDWVHPGDRDEMAHVLTLCLAGEPAPLVWRFPHPTRGWRHVATQFVPIRMPDGSTLAAAINVEVEDGLAQRLETARRSEREQIASHLHDDALQQLTGLRWTLASQGAGDEVLGQLEGVEAAIRLQMLRLQSPVSQLGLRDALDELVATARTPTRIECRGDLTGLPLDLADRAWRAARELLRNVDRHAEATDAVLEVVAEPHMLSISVTDDGVGLASEVWAQRQRMGHVGLLALREEASSAGGSFSVSAADGGRGTRVTVELPLGRSADGHR